MSRAVSNPDHAVRTRHALDMMLAAEALAGRAADDHQRRVVARQVWLFCGAFQDSAWAWRKDLARSGAPPAPVRHARAKLARLTERYKKTKPVRDVIASKRQPSHAVRAQDVTITLELWTSMSTVTMQGLTTAATTAYTALAEAAGAPSHVAIVMPPAATRAAFASLLPAGADERVMASTSSFAQARPGTAAILGGGDIGQRVTHVNDVDDQLKTMIALWPAVRGCAPYERLVRSAFIAEFSTMLDLTVGAPAPYPSKITPLLELCHAQDPGGPGEVVLTGLCDALDDDVRVAIKELRNRVGAHLDPSAPVQDLLDELDAVDVDEAIEHADVVREWLEYAALYDQSLRLLLWDGRVFKALDREQGPPPAPFDASRPPRQARVASPQLLDAAHVVMIDGPELASAALAGAIAGRQRELAKKFGVELREPLADD